MRDRDPDSAIARLGAIEGVIVKEGQFASQVPMLRGLGLVGLGRIRAAGLLADSLTRNRNEAGMFLLSSPVYGGFAPPGYGDSLTRVMRAARPARQSPSANPYELYFRAIFALGQGDTASARPLIQRGLGLDSAALTPFGGSWIRGLFEAADGWRRIQAGDSTAGLAAMQSGVKKVRAFGGPVMSAPLRLQLAVTLASRPDTRDDGIRRLRYGFGTDPQYLPITHFALGRALEAAGDRKGAAQEYGEFVRLWQGADPALQPKVEEARRALTALTAEPGVRR
jgi:hypothetical protein